MTLTLIQSQGQGHGGPKVAKMADYKVYLLRRRTCSLIKRLMVNYDIPRQYLNLAAQIFDIFDIRPRSASRDLQTYGVPPLATEFCLLRPAVPYGLSFSVYFRQLFSTLLRMTQFDCEEYISL